MRAVETIFFVVAFSFHDSGASACAVFMEIDVTMASGETIVLLEAVVIVIVATTTAATASHTSARWWRRRRSPSHALKPVAIPSLRTATRRLVKAIQIAR